MSWYMCIYVCVCMVCFFWKRYGVWRMFFNWCAKVQLFFEICKKNRILVRFFWPYLSPHRGEGLWMRGFGTREAGHRRACEKSNMILVVWCCFSLMVILAWWYAHHSVRFRWDSNEVPMELGGRQVAYKGEAKGNRSSKKRLIWLFIKKMCSALAYVRKK